jgi:hypothetical protein
MSNGYGACPALGMSSDLMGLLGVDGQEIRLATVADAVG